MVKIVYGFLKKKDILIFFTAQIQFLRAGGTSQSPDVNTLKN